MFSSSATAQKKKKKTTTRKTTATKPTPKSPLEVPAPPDFEILVEGSNSKVETSFVFIARDAETYALMRGLVEGLPSSTTIDFTKSAVVAAFAGTRNTGGWSVRIRKAVDKIVVDIVEPRKDAIVTQALTTPFQVTVVPVKEDKALPLSVSATWSNKMKTYRVSKGKFEYSGGIRGLTKKFDAEGAISVLSHGDYVTYNFNLSGKGSEGSRKLSEMASGFVTGGNIELKRLDAGSFSEMPRPPVRVSGTVSDEKLSLAFEPLPTNVADGFSARGKLEAIRIE